MYWQELLKKIMHEGDIHGEGTEPFSQDSKIQLLPVYLDTCWQFCEVIFHNLKSSPAELHILDILGKSRDMQAGLNPNYLILALTIWFSLM